MRSSHLTSGGRQPSYGRRRYWSSRKTSLTLVWLPKWWDHCLVCRVGGRSSRPCKARGKRWRGLVRENPVDVRRENSLALWVKTNCRCDQWASYGTCCMGHAGLCVDWKAAKLGQRSCRPVGSILVGTGLLVLVTAGWLMLWAWPWAYSWAKKKMAPMGPVDWLNGHWSQTR